MVVLMRLRQARMLPERTGHGKLVARRGCDYIRPVNDPRALFMAIDPVHFCPACHSPLKADPTECPACHAPRPAEGWAEDERIGTRLFGNILLKARLGAGAMGRVYLAEDPATGEKIAVKLLHPQLTGDGEVVKRFKVEAVVTKSLNIPQTVHTYDFGELPDGTHYLTMEYVQGHSLDRVLQAYGSLSLDNALEIVRQMLFALQAAHTRGVIHRDLKPGNILLAVDPQGKPLVKILDFGFAKVLADSQQAGFFQMGRVTRSNIILGTPSYMAPEQAKGDPGIDGRADLYTVGVILYRMLAGVPPFTSESVVELIRKQIEERPVPPSRHREGLPPALDRIIMRLLEKSPDKRYASALEVLEDLDREFPAGASAWRLEDFAAAAGEGSGLLAEMGRFVEDSAEIRAMAPARLPVWLWPAMAGVGAAMLLAMLWMLLR
jgi:serine/threonine-protein kinase